MKAPYDFKIGDRARVERADDEFMPRGWYDRIVTVIGRVVDDHGATPKDPLLVCEYKRGWYKARDAFWATELEPVKESKNA